MRVFCFNFALLEELFLCRGFVYKHLNPYTYTAQLNVDHTNISFVWESNSCHVAQWIVPRLPTARRVPDSANRADRPCPSVVALFVESGNRTQEAQRPLRPGDQRGSCSNYENFNKAQLETYIIKAVLTQSKPRERIHISHSV